MKMKVIQILSNEDKKILKLSFFVSIVFSTMMIIPAFIFNWWKWSFFLSVLLGYTASAVCYLKLVYVIFRETAFPSNKSKKAFVLNNLTNMIIYFSFLLFNLLIKWLNIYLCFIGMMIIKIIIYILYGRKPKVGEKKE